MNTKLWRKHLLDSSALRTHPDPILTPAPPVPNPFPLRMDDGSLSSLQAVMDKIESLDDGSPSGLRAALNTIEGSDDGSHNPLVAAVREGLVALAPVLYLKHLSIENTKISLYRT